MKYLTACRQLAGFTTGLESGLVNTARAHRRCANGAAVVKGAQGDGRRSESTQIAPRASAGSASNAVLVFLKLELREKSSAKTPLLQISPSQSVQIKKVSESPHPSLAAIVKKIKQKVFQCFMGIDFLKNWKRSFNKNLQSCWKLTRVANNFDLHLIVNN